MIIPCFWNIAYKFAHLLTWPVHGTRAFPSSGDSRKSQGTDQPPFQDGHLVRSLKGHGHWVNTLALSTEQVLRTGAFDHTGASPSTTEAAQAAAIERWALLTAFFDPPDTCCGDGSIPGQDQNEQAQVADHSEAQYPRLLYDLDLWGWSAANVVHWVVVKSVSGLFSVFYACCQLRKLCCTDFCLQY